MARAAASMAKKKTNVQGSLKNLQQDSHLDVLQKYVKQLVSLPACPDSYMDQRWKQYKVPEKIWGLRGMSVFDRLTGVENQTPKNSLEKRSNSTIIKNQKPVEQRDSSQELPYKSLEKYDQKQNISIKRLSKVSDKIEAELVSKNKQEQIN